MKYLSSNYNYMGYDVITIISVGLELNKLKIKNEAIIDNTDSIIFQSE